MSPLPYSIWDAIAAHGEGFKTQHLLDLFEQDNNRAENHTLSAAGISLDYSKNFFDAETKDLLTKLAKDCDFENHRQQMFSGASINNTEQRPALHTLLRAEKAPAGLETEFSDVSAALQQVEGIANRIRSGDWKGFTGKPIKQILHLGIGGSYLGPKMVDEALASLRTDDDIACHYVANVDAHHLDEVLKSIHQEETLVIVVSKSFTTLETKANAETARQWLLQEMTESDLSSHVIAISTNISAAEKFGIDKANILPMWDWVGGRYSVWSAVGIPIAIRYGMDNFRSFLQGASKMDQHFREATPANNLPFVMAFISTFYQHCFGATSHAVLTYDHRLRYLPDHLQQVDMESNGKTRNLKGEPLDYDSGAIIWGGEGTNGQHAFHQLLHQGTRFIGLDFIATLKPDHQHVDHHDKLIASCLSQSQALMQGRSEAELMNVDADLRPHKVMPGNRPSNTLFLEQLDAFHTGALIALYEHKVFCHANIWQINAFDQWGVELGKELGDKVLNAMSGGSENLDGSTRALLARYLKQRV